MLNRSASLAMSSSVLKASPGKLDIKRYSPSILYISASLAMSTSVLKASPGKLDIKRYSPSILYIAGARGKGSLVSKTRRQDGLSDRPRPTTWATNDHI